ncbi:MAG: FMN-binding protein [Flavobacteriaceae bacterium]
MKTIYPAFFILVSLFWSCKQKVAAEPQPKETVTQAPTQAPMSSIIKELGQFAGIDIPDANVADEMIYFKKINTNGEPENIDMDNYVALYQLLIRNGQGVELPILEIRGSDHAILIMGGKGFGGPIWAHVLVDRATREIKKTEFDHRLESDGYGAGITKPGFGNQFSDTKIALKSNTYGLDQTGQKIMEGSRMVDGLSGATVTSGAAVRMVNEGLHKYAGYLDQSE